MAASMDDLLQEIRRLREDVQRLQSRPIVIQQPYIPYVPYPYAPWVQPYPYQQPYPYVIYTQAPDHTKPHAVWTNAEIGPVTSYTSGE